jgi:hypothetical protein
MSVEGVLVVVAALLVAGWYLSYTATRVDRLHQKVQGSRAALDAQLVRRAAAALEVAQHLDPAAGLLLVDAATASLAHGEDAVPSPSVGGTGQGDPLDVPPLLEEVENHLSRTLHEVLDGEGVAALVRLRPFGADVLEVLAQACERVQWARRFYNDAVAQTQRVRRKRVVRWARLAGRAPMPSMIEIDDALPACLM